MLSLCELYYNVLLIIRVTNQKKNAKCINCKTNYKFHEYFDTFNDSIKQKWIVDARKHGKTMDSWYSKEKIGFYDSCSGWWKIRGKNPKLSEVFGKYLSEQGRLRILKYLKNKKDMKDYIILDAGGGNGHVSNTILKELPNATAFVQDISSYQLKLGRQFNNARITFIRGPMERMPLPDKSIDLVLCLEALEHTKGYDKFIKEAHRVLKDKGMLFITTPNKHGVAFRISEKDIIIDEEGNYERFLSSKQIIDSLKNKKFKIVRKEYTHIFPDLFFFIWNDYILPILFLKIILPFCNLLQYILHLLNIDKWFGFYQVYYARK